MKKHLFILTGIALVLLCACAHKDIPAQEIAASVPKSAETVELASEPAYEPSPALTPAPTAEPTPEPTATPTPAPTPFSVVWLTDSQSLAYHDSPLLHSLGEGVNKLIDSENVVAVIHTGDIVDNGFKSWQWDNFDKAYGYFEGKVPFYPVAGNHDMGVNKQSYKPFLQTRYLDDIPEEQRFQDGIIYYTVLEEGGCRILLLCGSFDALRVKGAQQWLDGLMDAYADIPCILITHGFLSPKTDTKLLNHNRVDEANVVRRYPNIRLVLCGHVEGYYTKEFSYDDDGNGTTDRITNALMLNYTQREYYAYRLLTFDPVTRSIAVKTYSADPETEVWVNTEEWGPIDFTLENAF